MFEVREIKIPTEQINERRRHHILEALPKIVFLAQERVISIMKAPNDTETRVLARPQTNVSIEASNNLHFCGM